MMTIGILCGLAAAAALSVSYVLSRLFVLRHRNGAFRLLILAHILMGGISAVLLPLFWPAQMPSAAELAGPLTGMAGFYMLGQVSLFVALRRTDASRASPLLGLKIVILAMISMRFLDQPLNGLQWAGAALAVAAAFVLSYSGKRIPAPAIAAIGVACVAYSLSDLHIQWAVRGVFGQLGLFHASMLALILSYILCGLVGLALLPLAGRATRAEWKHALPFVAAWYVAMIFLFACFGSVGVLLGNILQSTRGLISILLGAGLAAAGMVHVEARTPRHVLLRRIVAAGMMSLAIIAFVGGG